MTERAPAERTGGDPAVRVENLSKRYGGPEEGFLAVDDVSLDIEAGTVVGILGPNGAGKTTLIKSMLGLVVPTSGTVELAGADVGTERAAVYENVGAMLEGARNVYWRLSIRENLEFFAALAGQSPGTVRDRHDELLERFELREKADEPVKELSRGMKQKVSLASTLSRGGSILFLDEPTLGLDVESSVELRRELRALVDRESKTVVLSSHDMDVIEELCDRVVVMNEGAVIADDTVENLTGIFASQAYSVTMDGQLPERTRREIERAHAVEEFERTRDGNDRFEVVLDGGDALYDLVGTLSDSGVTVASIDASQPDLETAFLELIDGSESGANRPDNSGGETEPSRAEGVTR
jgi:ABC-2 type transport system ATP-binding protein